MIKYMEKVFITQVDLNTPYHEILSDPDRFGKIRTMPDKIVLTKCQSGDISITGTTPSVRLSVKFVKDLKVRAKFARYYFIYLLLNNARLGHEIGDLHKLQRGNPRSREY